MGIRRKVWTEGSGLSAVQRVAFEAGDHIPNDPVAAAQYEEWAERRQKDRRTPFERRTEQVARRASEIVRELSSRPKDPKDWEPRSGLGWYAKQLLFARRVVLENEQAGNTSVALDYTLDFASLASDLALKDGPAPVEAIWETALLQRERRQEAGRNRRLVSSADRVKMIQAYRERNCRGGRPASAREACIALAKQHKGQPGMSQSSFERSWETREKLPKS